MGFGIIFAFVTLKRYFERLRLPGVFDSYILAENKTSVFLTFEAFNNKILINKIKDEEECYKNFKN